MLNMELSKSAEIPLLEIYSKENLGVKVIVIGRVFALSTANPGLISGIPVLQALPGVNSVHHQKQTNPIFLIK